MGNAAKLMMRTDMRLCCGASSIDPEAPVGKMSHVRDVYDMSPEDPAEWTRRPMLFSARCSRLLPPRSRKNAAVRCTQCKHRRKNYVAKIQRHSRDEARRRAKLNLPPAPPRPPPPPEYGPPTKKECAAQTKLARCEDLYKKAVALHAQCNTRLAAEGVKKKLERLRDAKTEADKKLDAATEAMLGGASVAGMSRSARRRQARRVAGGDEYAKLEADADGLARAIDAGEAIVTNTEAVRPGCAEAWFAMQKAVITSEKVQKWAARPRKKVRKKQIEARVKAASDAATIAADKYAASRQKPVDDRAGRNWSEVRRVLLKKMLRAARNLRAAVAVDTLYEDAAAIASLRDEPDRDRLLRRLELKSRPALLFRNSQEVARDSGFMFGPTKRRIQAVKSEFAVKTGCIDPHQVQLVHKQALDAGLTENDLKYGMFLVDETDAKQMFTVQPDGAGYKVEGAASPTADAAKQSKGHHTLERVIKAVEMCEYER